MSLPRFRIGTASWTDPTLLAAAFYPPAAKTAEARLRFYAEHFDTVEVDSTYYALPSERNATLWAQRTPPDFQFDIKAFAWLTQHAAETRALPQAIKSRLLPEQLRQARLEAPHGELLGICFALFHAALQPLRMDGKLGCILLQFPPWFTATPRNEEYISSCRARLHDDQLAVEFRHSSWFGGRTASTLDFLRRQGLSLVSLDAPAAPSIAQPPFCSTAPTAYVRLHGRNRDAWFARQPSAAERFKYLYSDTELRDCAARVREIRGASVVHVIFNNCYADYGVRNALAMRQLLDHP